MTGSHYSRQGVCERKADKDRHWSDLRELASTSLPITTPPMLAPPSLALFGICIVVGICILVVIVSIFASEENDSNLTPN